MNQRFNPVTGRLEYYFEPPAGARGEKGDKGERGEQGLPGLNGKDGLIGLTGARGEAGAQGSPGLAGAAGLNGLDGKDGLNGKDGKDMESKPTVLYSTKVPLQSFGKDNDWCFNVAGELFFKKSGKWEFFGSIDSRIQRGTHAMDIRLDDSAAKNTIIGKNVQEFINRMYESTESQVPTYSANGTINYVEYFSSSTQTTANRTFRTDLTYNTDLEPTTEITKIYSKTDGTTILKTITKTYTWVNNILTNRTQVTV